jgi:threonine synthase
MKYYSTNNPTARGVKLEDAVIRGLAPDRGLYMPAKIKVLPKEFYETIHTLSFQEIAYHVADAFFGRDIPAETLRQIINDTLNFNIPLVPVTENIYSLELFHGPTLAFKDVGARFMARLLSYFISKHRTRNVNVLVATSGDTGSAVANGFLGVKGIHVYVLYPKGMVSEIQEKQFTTQGQNITAIAIDGTFDDCQRLVKQAFADEGLNQELFLTSANSINVARFLPQAFYYFYAYAQASARAQAEGKRLSHSSLYSSLVISVPSGNFGNITAGLFAKRMGLPIRRFIAANNRNDVFYRYLQTGDYTPRPTIATIANAMDVGNPSNFARVLDLYKNDYCAICRDIRGAAYNNDQIIETIRTCWEEHQYMLDPHGACAYKALKEGMQQGETGIFLETAHPAKFKNTMDLILSQDISLPRKLRAFMKKRPQSVAMNNDFTSLKQYLLSSSDGK